MRQGCQRFAVVAQDYFEDSMVHKLDAVEKINRWKNHSISLTPSVCTSESNDY